MSIPFPSGVITATLTPLKSDLSVDVAKLIRHCHWLFQQGSDGIALLGTTGEASSFGQSEKMSLLEAIAKSDLPTEKIMVGTGTTAYTETVQLTQHAVDLGMPNVLMLPPYYYKQINKEGIMQYFDLIIKSIDRTDLQVYLYHIPQMTGVNLSADLIAELVRKYPKTMVGMKDSSGNVESMTALCKLLPGFRLYAGTERYLLDVLQAGGVGCISATANVTAHLAARVYQAWLSKQDVENLQQEAIHVRACFEGLPFTAALKQWLALAKNDSEWTHIRPPNSLISQADLDKLDNELKLLAFSLAS